MISQDTGNRMDAKFFGVHGTAGEAISSVTITGNPFFFGEFGIASVDTPDPNPVPEPTTLTLLCAGLVAARPRRRSS
jgi:hypothetical protein